jgi:hypothetical protein
MGGNWYLSRRTHQGLVLEWFQLGKLIDAHEKETSGASMF